MFSVTFNYLIWYGFCKPRSNTASPAAVAYVVKYANALPTDRDNIITSLAAVRSINRFLGFLSLLFIPYTPSSLEFTNLHLLIHYCLPAVSTDIHLFLQIQNDLLLHITHDPAIMLVGICNTYRIFCRYHNLLDF